MLSWWWQRQAAAARQSTRIVLHLYDVRCANQPLVAHAQFTQRTTNSESTWHKHTHIHTQRHLFGHNLGWGGEGSRFLCLLMRSIFGGERNTEKHIPQYSQTLLALQWVVRGLDNDGCCRRQRVAFTFTEMKMSICVFAVQTECVCCENDSVSECQWRNLLANID